MAEVNRHCLDDVQLAALGELALRRDIEWAFQDGTLFLLQCRAITASKGRSDTPPPVPPRSFHLPYRVGVSATRSRVDRKSGRIAVLL